MLRSISLLLLLPLVFGASGVFAQTKKPSSPGKIPTAKDSAISVIVYMRDANKNEVSLGTRQCADYPDYDAVVLQRLCAAMKPVGPAYKQDDEVAYTWSTKGKVP